MRRLRPTLTCARARAVLLAVWLSAAGGTVGADSSAPPEAPAHPLEMAADLLQAWADAADCLWPTRPGAEALRHSPDPWWDRMDARWSTAGPTLRAAYAELAYVRALKADQWRLLGGERGTPATEAYFRALVFPLSRALLILDDLQRIAALHLGSPDASPPQSVTATARALLSEAVNSSEGLLPPESLLTRLPAHLRPELSPVHASAGEVALAVGLPAVRQGADLALLLPLVAATVAPGGEANVSLVLHLQGLPLLEVTFPGPALARFRTDDLGLVALWEQATLVSFVPDLPLVPAEFLLTSAEVPPGATYKAPVTVTTTEALETIGLDAAAPGAVGICRAARQELVLPESRLEAVAVLAQDSAAARRLSAAIEAAPAPRGEATTVWGRGSVVVWLGGPAAVVTSITERLGEVPSLTGQPQVPVPAPVRAVLEPGSWPPPPQVISCLTRVLLCRSVDDRGRPQGITDTFPAGVPEVGVYLEIGTAPPDTMLLVQWYREGRLLHVHEAFRAASRTSRFLSLTLSQGQGLGSGVWRVEIYQDGVKVEEREFTIGGRR